MRKYMICVAVAVAAVATGAIANAADSIQTLDVSVSPSKLDKKKFKSIQLGFDIKTGPDSGATLNQDQPPNATKTVVDFPKNLKIDTSAVPRCKVDPGSLENTSTETAIKLCGRKSVISVADESFSHVTLDTAPTVADPSQTAEIPVVLTAFNGSKKNTLIFHNRADLVNNTTILHEQLKPSKANGYGTSLITNIPPIAVGGVDEFKVTIKKGTIVKSRCKSTQNKFQITSTFPTLEEPTVSSTSSAPCKRK